MKQPLLISPILLALATTSSLADKPLSVSSKYCPPEHELVVVSDYGGPTRRYCINTQCKTRNDAHMRSECGSIKDNMKRVTVNSTDYKRLTMQNRGCMEKYKAMVRGMCAGPRPAR